MKAFGSFCAGAFAGFLLGSSKPGCAMRKGLDDMIGNFFSNDENSVEKESANADGGEQELSKKEQAPAKSNGESSSRKPALKSVETGIDEQIAPGSGEGLDMDKAQELKEKLGAKVAEVQGDESLPHSHSHQIETPTSRLTA